MDRADRRALDGWRVGWGEEETQVELLVRREDHQTQPTSCPSLSGDCQRVSWFHLQSQPVSTFSWTSSPYALHYQRRHLACQDESLPRRRPTISANVAPETSAPAPSPALPAPFRKSQPSQRAAPSQLRPQPASAFPLLRPKVRGCRPLPSPTDIRHLGTTRRERLVRPIGPEGFRWNRV